jgi:hypothetical protein
VAAPCSNDRQGAPELFIVELQQDARIVAEAELRRHIREPFLLVVDRLLRPRAPLTLELIDEHQRRDAARGARREDGGRWEIGEKSRHVRVRDPPP